MKQLIGILTLLVILFACAPPKKGMKTNGKDRMVFTVTHIQDEKDGQTISMTDERGGRYITVISIPNGNFIDLTIGDQISLIAEEIMESDPAQIISKDIRVITDTKINEVNYEKSEDEIVWIGSRFTQAIGMWEQEVNCLQVQYSETLNKDGKWDLLCEEIEDFEYLEGKYYRIKVRKHWLTNHENLMDRAPYDLQFLGVIEIIEDPTYINPVKTTISTDKANYAVGEPIPLTMTIENTGEQPFTFLDWGTPMEGTFTGDCLTVTNEEGNPIIYSGIMVKRVPPTDADYTTLPQGKTASGSANLLDGYQLTEPGAYQIQFLETYPNIPASNVIEIVVE